MSTLTKKQKLNTLRISKESFESRLNSMIEETSLSDRLSQSFLERKSDLEKSIRFCEYLEMILIHGRDFERENIKMLDFIGLKELYEKESQEIN